MSLFGSLQNAGNTLQAMQIGLQVVGNNIANANTPGFIREQVNYTPAPVQRLGTLQIGLGVRVESITQQLDKFLGDQLRDANGDRFAADVQNKAYKELEGIVGELSDRDLSTALTEFFNSIKGMTSPTSGEAFSTRSLAVRAGEKFADAVKRLDERGAQVRDGYNAQIVQSASDVNRLATEIQKLNVRITQTEGGSAGTSQAGALRTQRNNLVNDLAELIDATVVEQPSGGLSISLGGEFLVFEGQRREIAVIEESESGLAVARIEFADTGKEIELTKGRLAGLQSARDEIVGGFRERLDAFAKTIMFEFNKQYSRGQGITGFTTLTSHEGIRDATLPLDEAGLAFTPQNGEFYLRVTNTRTNTTTTTRIDVDLLGLDDDTTLGSLATSIDAVSGVSASIDASGKLTIRSDSPEVEFRFADDTSGALAALGLNTFFTGTGASNIGVNRELEGLANAGKFAAGKLIDGNRVDELGNALDLYRLADKPIESLGGASIFEQYDQMLAELTQGSTVAGSVAEGIGVYADTLAGEFEAVSGVNLDEEAINMISLQRIYQATARYILTIQEMLDTLVQL
ncbi:MAG: flagellar hook-associated protein FlgK [Lacipirellulaceae bacterium]